jgi:hypothetical protein
MSAMEELPLGLQLDNIRLENARLADYIDQQDRVIARYKELMGAQDEIIQVQKSIISMLRK